MALALLPTVFGSTGETSLSKLYNRDISNDLNDVNDIRYTAIVQIAGRTYNLLLDTGSTVNWLNPPEGVGAFNDTGVEFKQGYGDGSSFVSGHIGLAEMVVAGRTIPQQAFLNVTKNVGQSPCTSALCGLIGLNFKDPTGTGLPPALSAAGLDGDKLGKSLLSHVFEMNATAPWFFALALSRMDDVNDTADASLAISEYDPRYTDVPQEPQNPIYPPGSYAWSILSDGIFINGAPIAWPSVTKSTPPGKNIIEIDSGTPSLALPTQIRDAIYGAVPGAVLAQNTSIPGKFQNSDKNIWVVPCNTSMNFTVTFGGHAYPFHPLDMTKLYTQVGPDRKTYTICVNTISGGGDLTDGTRSRQDSLFGDTFMRNVYSVFSFGDNTTAPFVQFLSVVNETEAVVDFTRVRQRHLVNGPPELSPAALIALFDGPRSVAASVSATSPSDASTSSPTSSPPAAKAGDAALKLAADLPDDSHPASDSDSQIAKYAPIVIGLLGANLLILLVLLVVGVGFCLTRGDKKNGDRSAATWMAGIRVVGLHMGVQWRSL
ncbi:aspartic peptidase domain-containing protein [Mycena belliarum]|uniref:Aspartic peptidase domain-containing protein n=1 Tax=Mycena belliarum TaxID=1033014 RepID=A0AAD6XM49_9AGAR|nr:aspartic peptidase domain-containing protein [Mycena belliae]